MFNIQSLKKMATERIARKFEQIFGWLPFNVYEDREMMIAMLMGSDMPEFELERGQMEYIATDENDEMGLYMPQYKAYFRVMYHHSIIQQLFDAINYVWTPVRTESKGRKSQFGYRDVWDMIYAYEAGMKLSEIAKYFSTNSQIIWQILTGKSYQWASGITKESFE